MELNFKSVESHVLKKWKENNTAEKYMHYRTGKKKYYFLDGPPYATASIHMGTAWNKILKDYYIRFKRLQGFDCKLQAGFDMHGLPIENKVEKKLELKNKDDIEKLGIEKFVKECRKFAEENLGNMSQQFQDLAVWMDFDKPYLTLNREYIEGAWHTFKVAYEKGYLTLGKYPIHVCSHCQTCVAFNEIEYTKREDPAVFVKFKVKGKRNEFLVIWTTTPWTLPSNTGIMVHPDFDYAKIEVETDVEGKKEVLIIARELVDKVLKKAKLEKVKTVEVLKGKELRGLEYDNPLKEIVPLQKKVKAKVVTSSQFVSLEDGSGLVHCAPGHGSEDYKVGKENGLSILSPVKLNGCYEDDVGEFLKGQYVKKADPKIIEYLKQQNALLAEGTVNHDYPKCWRCSTPLLFLSVPQWFFKVEDIKTKLLNGNDNVNWVPKWSKDRFKNWLEGISDWPISRQRYWGIPLPIWTCDKCEDIKVLGNSKELKQKVDDLHRPFIDKVVFDCEKCNGKMHRIPDVLDVWFDSGVAPWASLNYPTSKAFEEFNFQADLEIEGPDQFRGWWNSQAIAGTITFDKIPFKNVILHGFVLDNHGVKMSKSLGNVTVPKDITTKYSVDSLRFYLLSFPPETDFYFDVKKLEEKNKFFMTLFNILNFKQMYASGRRHVGKLEEHVEDAWIKSKANSLVKKVIEQNEQLQSFRAVNAIEEFVLNNLSKEYIKFIRDRVSEEGASKEAALKTLDEVLLTLARIMAPAMPFTAEVVYELAGGRRESAHLEDIPEISPKGTSEQLELYFEIAKSILESSAAARQEAKLKLKWPIKEIIVIPETGGDETKKAVMELESLLELMGNAKQVEIADKIPRGFIAKPFSFASIKGIVGINVSRDEELLNEAMLREFVRKVQATRKDAKLSIDQRIELNLMVKNEKLLSYLKQQENELRHGTGASEVKFGGRELSIKGKLELEGDEINFSFELKK